MNVAVIGERSRLGEGELESLVLGDIARGIEDSSRITGHRIGSLWTRVKLSYREEWHVPVQAM